VVVSTLTGTKLFQLVAHGVKRGGAAFPQVSGLTFDVAGGLPLNVKVKGKPIDLNAKYTVATDDFMADGGEGYSVLKDAERRETDKLTRDALVDYIAKRKVVSPPQVD